MSSKDASKTIKCANPECEKPSGKLVCPKCKEESKPLGVSSFCSQDCFKTFWPIHKLTHELAASAGTKGAENVKTAA